MITPVAELELIYNGPVPVWQQVAAWLRQRIQAGEWGPNDRLPTELQLVQELGIARETARKAIALLRDEGLVYTVHAQGTFVSQDPA